jgi:two-component sensor histidine kinase/ABC-type amino acid transport substrate-binding protein
LKIVDEFHFDGIGKEDVRFGVNPENKILHSILQKGLNAISDEDKAFLINKWIGSNFNKYENNIDLTQEERDYLATKGVIKVCVDPNWMPIERINENGIHEGIASDFLSLIAKRANIKLELYKTVTWTESLEATHDGKCDILSFLNTTDDRTKWLNFTKVIHEEPRVFITRGEHEFIIDAKLIKNKTIALPKDYSTVEIIRNIYPNLKIILVDSELEALRLVSEGKADMTLNTLNVSAYTIKKEGFFNLKVAGQMSNIPNTFSIGVIKNEGEVLVNILNKAIDTISSAEKEEIINKYVSIDIKQGIDYAIFWKIFIIVTLVVLSVFGILLYRNRLLNLYNTKLTKAKIDLENEVGQKELLLKELNHRVKNNLQIISGIVSLQSSKKDTSSVLEEIENNISTISVAYDLLTQKEYTGKIELKHYLETLLDSIIPIQTFTIQRYVMSKEVYLDIHDAVNIGLIVTECINNAVKYAFCEQESNHTIIISIEEDDTNITINFSDNGRGFNDLDNKGLGLELIRTLCNNKLKTKPIFYNNNGANVKILIVK